MIFFLVCLRLKRHLLMAKVCNREEKGRAVARNPAPFPYHLYSKARQKPVWEAQGLGCHPLTKPVPLGKSLCPSRSQFLYSDNGINSAQETLGGGLRYLCSPNPPSPDYATTHSPAFSPTPSPARLCQVLGNEDLTRQEKLGGVPRALPAACSSHARCLLLPVLPVIN